MSLSILHSFQKQLRSLLSLSNLPPLHKSYGTFFFCSQLYLHCIRTMAPSFTTNSTSTAEELCSLLLVSILPSLQLNYGAFFCWQFYLHYRIAMEAFFTANFTFTGEALCSILFLTILPPLQKSCVTFLHCQVYLHYRRAS